MYPVISSAVNQTSGILSKFTNSISCETILRIERQREKKVKSYPPPPQSQSITHIMRPHPKHDRLQTNNKCVYRISMIAKQEIEDHLGGQRKSYLLTISNSSMVFKGRSSITYIRKIIAVSRAQLTSSSIQ